MAALEKPGRAVITATKSGTEKNATVFARYWVQALHDPDSRCGQERRDQRDRGVPLRHQPTRLSFTSRKSGWPPSIPYSRTPAKHDAVREASTDTGEGLLLSSFTLIRLGAAQKAYADPAKRALARA